MDESRGEGAMTLKEVAPCVPLRLPAWLRRQVPRGPEVERVRRVVTSHGLKSVCEAAACPNRLECYSKGRVTFMILGDVCTRNCHYCKVATGKPLPVDLDEPDRLVSAAKELGLSCVVITSVCRDDLGDGGAGQFARTIEGLRKWKIGVKVEVLIPDFKNSLAALETVLKARPTVLNHNVETVPRLYALVRPQGKYEWAIELLGRVKRISPQMPVKSGLMVGLGEQDAEVLEVMRDLRAAGCDIVTIGQYMRPSVANYPVQRYVTPKEFQKLEAAGRRMGFKHIAARPLVRSSFEAADIMERMGVGMER